MKNNPALDQAKALLPKSTIIPDRHEVEIQIDGIAYLFQFENKSIDESRYGTWHFVEQEDLRVKNPRGRPRKSDDSTKVEKQPQYRCNSYSQEEIERVEQTTNLVCKDSFDIDGVEVLIFRKKVKV